MSSKGYRVRWDAVAALVALFAAVLIVGTIGFNA